MSNFAAPADYPYALKDPFPSADANALIEQLLKTINADEGSAHQPTGDIAWSGASGHGMTFADLFPFAGELDVTNTLTFTSATSGLVQFGALVPVRVYGLLTIKASVGGLVIEHGASETVHGGFTLASDSAGTFAGPISLKGTLTVENTGGGGPGGIVWESDAVLDIGTLYARVLTGCALTWQGTATLVGASTATGSWAGTWNFTGSADLHLKNTSTFTTDSGVQSTFNGPAAFTNDVDLTGDTTFASSTVPLLDPARPWTRRARVIAGTYYDGSVSSPLAAVGIFASNSPGTMFQIIAGIGANAAAIAIFEFDPPPDGATMAEVKVRGHGVAASPGTLDALPVYRVIRWQDGIDAAPEAMSNLTTDGHAIDGSNWDSSIETTISINAHATVDTDYRYAVAMTVAPTLSSSTLAFYLNAKATGTNDKLTGR